MTETFYFYDLETSGFHPANDRIMQFAGQRTTLDLKPIGEPDNILIKIAADVLPGPDAVLIHGITPQQTLLDGISEAEFLDYFQTDIAIPGTIFTGFNSIRFDDEFMRYMHYRNMRDAYTWQWEEGKGRWDLLDVVRMTRALRPDGINWPFDSDGKPVNRLELLTSLNNIEHSNAHDALADVRATIAIAQLIQTKQPKLFDFLLQHRDKKAVQKLAMSGLPFVYSSGKYASEHEKTTVTYAVREHPDGRGALVFDVRFDPTHYIDMNPSQLVAAWQLPWDDPQRLPVKTLKYNRCPAIAPLSVLDSESQKRLHLSLDDVDKHVNILKKSPDFAAALCHAVEKLDKERQTRLVETPADVDGRLYEAFIDMADKKLLYKLLQTAPQDITQDKFQFHDQRLAVLLPLYKARNFPKALTPDEEIVWNKHVHARLQPDRDDGALVKYFERISELQKTAKTKNDEYLLEELKLFGLSLLPTDGFAG